MCRRCGPAQGLAVDMVCAAPVGSTARSHTDTQAAAQHAQPTTLVSCAEAPADGESFCTGLVLAVALIQVCSRAVACRVCQHSQVFMRSKCADYVAEFDAVVFWGSMLLSALQFATHTAVGTCIQYW